MIVPRNSHTYMNCLDRLVLVHPFWALVTFPVCSSVLSFWTNRTPFTLSSSIFLLRCLWGKPIAVMAQQVCLLISPLSALLLVCGLTISSPRESWYRHLQWFFCCIYASNISQTENSFKHQCLVDFMQVSSLTSLFWISYPLSVALECMMNSGLWSFSSPMLVL